MRVLLVGSGGREHVLAWGLRRSAALTDLLCCPGNPGIATLARCLPVPATDIAALARVCREEAVDLVVPGPEAPLVAGLADALGEAGIACAGPDRAAARLEGSKAFMKEVCAAAGVRTASWEVFDDRAAALEFVRRRGAPLVVKQDGLAAGKGVVVARTEADAAMAVERLGRDGPILIEEVVEGEELSVFALCDGADCAMFGAARDHKRLGAGDTGPNTGGMGACVTPALLDPALLARVRDEVIRPVLAEMARRGCPFRGVLFAGLMISDETVTVLEFNVRFGDPETQALIPLFEGDLLAALAAVASGGVAGIEPRWASDAAVAVTLAAPGYPDAPVAGSRIAGLDTAGEHALVFHAGTGRGEDGGLRAAGGRVLTVVGRGPTLAEARAAAYRGVGRIEWPEGVFRPDIGIARDLPPGIAGEGQAVLSR